MAGRTATPRSANKCGEIATAGDYVPARSASEVGVELGGGLLCVDVYDLPTNSGGWDMGDAVVTWSQRQLAGWVPDV